MRKYINIQESIATGDEANEKALAFGLGRELWRTINIDPDFYDDASTIGLHDYIVSKVDALCEGLKTLTTRALGVKFNWNRARAPPVAPIRPLPPPSLDTVAPARLDPAAPSGWARRPRFGTWPGFLTPRCFRRAFFLSRRARCARSRTSR